VLVVARRSGYLLLLEVWLIAVKGSESCIAVILLFLSSLALMNLTLL
jgi:hypothetical protein